MTIDGTDEFHGGLSHPEAAPVTGEVVLSQPRLFTAYHRRSVSTSRRRFHFSKKMFKPNQLRCTLEIRPKASRGGKIFDRLLCVL